MDLLNHLLFFDVDATGKKIYDELVSISATTYNNTLYDSFIMPSSNFSEEAKFRLHLSINNSQNVRVMKDTKTKQAVATKSLYIVMKEFLHWLKENNPQRKKYWLIYYGANNLPALLLLKSLIRFKLYEEFTDEVEYFINLNEDFKQSVQNTLTSEDPKVMFSVLLNVEEKEINIARAQSRRSVVSKVFNHLITGMDQQDVIKKLKQHARLLPSISEELESEFDLLKKRSSLDPIFKKLFSTHNTRAKYVKLRNELVDNGITYDILKEKFSENTLKEFIGEKIEPSDEALKVVMNHFSNLKVPTATSTTTESENSPITTSN